MFTALDKAVFLARSLSGPRKGQYRIADACGVSYQYIQRLRRDWRKTGNAPDALLEFAPAIENLLGGAIKADELYPAVDWLRNESGQITGYQVSICQPAADSVKAA